MGAATPDGHGEHPSAGAVHAMGITSLSAFVLVVVLVLLTSNTTIAWISYLVLPLGGIVGAVLGVIVWVKGARARREISAGAPYAWVGRLRNGYVMGVLGTVLGLLGALAIAGLVVAALIFWANCC